MLEIVRTHIRQWGVPPSTPELSRALGRTTGTVGMHLQGLAAKGWIERTLGLQRGYWPTDMVTVPIVDPGESDASQAQGLAGCRIIERVASVLCGQLDPRPDCFVAVTSEVGAGLGLECGDLIALDTRAQARDGEIVVARAAASGHLVCGTLHQRDAHRRELRPPADTAAATSILGDASHGGLRIEGVVIGAVTFRDLDRLRKESDRARGSSGRRVEYDDARGRREIASSGAPARRPGQDASLALLPRGLVEPHRMRSEQEFEGGTAGVAPRPGRKGQETGNQGALAQRRGPAPSGAARGDVERVRVKERSEGDQGAAVGVAPGNRAGEVDERRRRRVGTELPGDANGRLIETDHEVPAGECAAHRGMGARAHAEDAHVVPVPSVVHRLELGPGVHGQELGACAHDVTGLPYEALRRDDEEEGQQRDLARGAVAEHRSDDHAVAHRVREPWIFITRPDEESVLAALAGCSDPVLAQGLEVSEGVGVHLDTAPAAVPEAI